MGFVLVDSSVWISCFLKNPPQYFVERIVAAKEEKVIATCGLIYLEVVRGARDKKEFQEFSEEFHSLHWLPVTEEHWDLAGKMGFELSRKGYHPPNTDLLIAAVAVTNKCVLLQRDKDFEHIAKFFPLRLT